MKPAKLPYDMVFFFVRVGVHILGVNAFVAATSKRNFLELCFMFFAWDAHLRGSSQKVVSGMYRAI